MEVVSHLSLDSPDSLTYFSLLIRIAKKKQKGFYHLFAFQLHFFSSFGKKTSGLKAVDRLLPCPQHTINISRFWIKVISIFSLLIQTVIYSLLCK